RGERAAHAAQSLTWSHIVITTSWRLHKSNSAVFLVTAARFRAPVCCFPHLARPARGGRSAERRTFSPVAPAKRDHRVRETGAVQGDGDAACRRPTVAIFGRRTARS